MKSERFEDLFDVVWDGRTELLPPRDQKGYPWATVDGPGTPDRQKPKSKPTTGPGSGGNHNPLGLGGPKRKHLALGIGPSRAARMAARAAEWKDLFDRFAPTRCRCGCGGHLDQRSVSLTQARRGQWSRYRQGHGGKDTSRRQPGKGSLEFNGPIIRDILRPEKGV